MLAERTIKAAKPTGKDQFLADGNGLYVRIAKSGTKTFVYKDQRGGKTRWVTLGRYPDLTLLEARQKAIEIKSGGTTVNTTTVRQLCDAYYTYTEKHYKRPIQVVHKLEPNIALPLGSKRLNQVTRAMLTGRFKIIAERAPVMANRVMEETKKMFFFAREKGWVKENPLADVTRRVAGGREKSRDVTLSFTEIEDFIALLGRRSGMDKGTAWALYFTLVTGCRIVESVWCLRHKSLELPAEVCKYRTHKVPATPHIRAILKLAPPPPKWPITLSAALRRNGCHYTPHDLRRTYASRLADLGVMPHVIEKLLNHQMEGVMAVYNRAEFWPERIAAQKLWDKTLRELRKKVALRAKLDQGEGHREGSGSGETP